MDRHKDIIHSTKVIKKDVKRLEWAKYENIEKMYNFIYPLIVECGIACYLPEPVYYRSDGTIGDEEDFVGFQSDLQLLYPDYLLFVDETGSNTNMSADGQRGRKRVIADIGNEGHSQAINTDIRYTTLGFTAATGDPVCCVIIFQSENPEGISKWWVSGLDITKIRVELEQMNDEDLLEQCGTEGDVCGGGPVCYFQGKRIPTLVKWSPHGGITGEILTSCLKYMDDLNVFPRTLPNGDKIKPFILLDGHNSRFDINFLAYIREAEHPWGVGFGLPYATHWWQVGDSHQQNGSYKRVETQAKEELLSAKEKRGLPLVFQPTDVIPVALKAWSRSFANKESNRKAIFERGWNPLNRQLLTATEVLRSRDLLAQRENNVVASIPMTSALQNVNVNSGFAGDVFDILFQNRDQDQVAARRASRETLATATNNVRGRIKKLTSGQYYARGIASCNHDAVWENAVTHHQQTVVKEQQDYQKRDENYTKRKNNVEKIRNKDRTMWSNSEIKTLLTYKRVKGDPTIASFGNNRELMLAEWERRQGRNSPVKPQRNRSTVVRFDENIMADDDFGQSELPDYYSDDVRAGGETSGFDTTDVGETDTI